MLIKKNNLSHSFYFLSMNLVFPLPSALCELKGPSEMCDVWRGDILAGIQLIVHQSGWAAMTALTHCIADRWQLPARHSRPQKQHRPTMSDALGMEISVSAGCPAHLLCFLKDEFACACFQACTIGSQFFFNLSLIAAWAKKLLSREVMVSCVWPILLPLDCNICRQMCSHHSFRTVLEIRV